MLPNRKNAKKFQRIRPKTDFFMLIGAEQPAHSLCVMALAGCEAWQHGKGSPVFEVSVTY